MLNPDRLPAPDIAALASQRVDGLGGLVAHVSAGRTRIADLVQHGSAKLRMPHVAEGPLEAILINTAGGLTGGDRLRWRVRLEPGATATLTTQACEKAYRSAGGSALVDTSMFVSDGASLAWLPQETIVYEGSSLRRQSTVELARSGRLLMLETVVFGRLAMGESTRHATFHDRWRIRCDGRLVHAEDFALGPDVAATLARAATTAGSIAIATVLLVDEDAPARLDAVRSILGETGDASCWTVGGTGKLLARLVAEDSYSLRKRLVPLIGLLNGKPGLPKVWSL